MYRCGLSFRKTFCSALVPRWALRLASRSANRNTVRIARGCVWSGDGVVGRDDRRQVPRDHVGKAEDCTTRMSGCQTPGRAQVGRRQPLALLLTAGARVLTGTTLPRSLSGDTSSGCSLLRRRSHCCVPTCRPARTIVQSLIGGSATLVVCHNGRIHQQRAFLALASAAVT